jgi:hypothetical protein
MNAALARTFRAVGDAVTAARLGFAGVIIAAVLASVASWVSAVRQFDAKMVEIGIGILSTDPGGTDAAASRAWAIKLVEKNSGLKFSQKAREELLSHPLGGKKSENKEAASK